MRESDPEFWGTATGQGIVDGINRGVSWLGVKINGKVVSVGSMRLTEWGGLIGTVAIHKDHRKQGIRNIHGLRTCETNVGKSAMGDNLRFSRQPTSNPSIREGRVQTLQVILFHEGRKAQALTSIVNINI